MPASAVYALMSCGDNPPTGVNNNLYKPTSSASITAEPISGQEAYLLTYTCTGGDQDKKGFSVSGTPMPGAQSAPEGQASLTVTDEQDVAQTYQEQQFDLSCRTNSQGESSTSQASVNVPPKVAPQAKFELDARIFFDNTPNTDLEATIDNLTTGKRFLLKADANGRIYGVIDEGDLELAFYDPTDKQLHRTNNIHDDKRSTCDYTDYSDRSILFTLTGDGHTGIVETVADSINLDEMLSQYSLAAELDSSFAKFISTLRAGVTQDMPFWRTGNPTGDPNLPPYDPYNAAQEAAFDEYTSDMLAGITIPNDICGPSPFSFNIVKVEGEDILNYIYKDPVIGLWKPYPNTHPIFHQNMTSFELVRVAQDTINNRPVYVVNYSVIGNGRIDPGGFSNEDTKFGSLRESNPPICSIRDGAIDPLCEFEGTYSRKDLDFLRIVAAYAALAQEFGENLRVKR